jgi:hypothetical protein
MFKENMEMNARKSFGACLGTRVRNADLELRR